MPVGIHIPTYVEAYAQRLYDAHRTEYRSMTDEGLLEAIGEALEVVCASGDEIEAVAMDVRKLLREDALPASLVAQAPFVDDGLFR